jgi:hypothetical protein
MLYVALVAIVPTAILPVCVALAPRVESAGHHWVACRQQAAHSNRLAASYRLFASRSPANAVIPGLTVRRTEKGPVIPATGDAAAKMARYFADRACLFERAKWHPWAGMPSDPPWPRL